MRKLKIKITMYKVFKNSMFIKIILSNTKLFEY